MRSSIKSRRAHRKVGVDDDDEPHASEPVVVRPAARKNKNAPLKSAAPLRPRPSTSSEDLNEKTVDVVAKFGVQQQDVIVPSIIPSEAEIREKKERRARLAKEKDFISLDADGEDAWDNEDERDANDSDEFVDKRFTADRSNVKEPDSRLVREDEDLAEGFEEFVEDGNISLGKKAEEESRRKRRVEMASMIAEAEGGNDSDGSVDSVEEERNAAYEAAQTRAAIYDRGAKSMRTAGTRGAPRIPKIPELSAILERMVTQLREMESTQARKAKRLEDIRAEKAEIAEREEMIQKQLSEAGERYKKLSAEAGISSGTFTPTMSENGQRLIVQCGLESLSATPMSTGSGGADYFEQEKEQDAVTK